MIRFYNTAARAKQDFKPLTESQAKLYTCGPTVYSELTVGNWAAYIRWDLLVRVLKLNGYQVSRVMNITDVGHLTSDADEGEDKMLKGARREQLTEWDVADKYIKSFQSGMSQLNLIQPEFLVRATDYIDQQIALVKTLEAKGYTYQISDGVYFDTAKFPRYADFAGLDLTALKAGARVENKADKRNPSDFVLWRLTPTGEARAMEWDSPWGRGIPGWHIECSAMAMDLLGPTIDIHTGGIDHIPVHHTNEIAQSEAASGQVFANYWLHTDFLLVNGTKISKSLGNGFTLKDIDDYGLRFDDFRLFILQSHYRSESNFTWDNLTAAHNRLDNWLSLAELRWQIHDTVVDDEDKAVSQSSLDLRRAQADILKTLNDDLNSAKALSLIDQQIDRIKASPGNLQQDVLMEFIDFIEAFSGLRLLSETPDIDDDTKQLILARLRAREAKDFKKSDDIRDQLKAVGLRLLDTASGQLWTRY